ncbi:hypothetical protein SODG_006433 [Sodalis praecaptivus]
MQQGGGIGVHHPYGIFAVLLFKLEYQVDEFIRRWCSTGSDQLFQCAERSLFIAFGITGIDQKTFCFLAAITCNQVCFLRLGKGVGDFLGQPRENIDVAEIKNFLCGLRVGIYREELNTDLFQFRRRGFATLFPFLAVRYRRAPYGDEFFIFVAVNPLYGTNLAHLGVIHQTAHNLFVEFGDNRVTTISRNAG